MRGGLGRVDLCADRERSHGRLIYHHPRPTRQWKLFCTSLAPTKNQLPLRDGPEKVAVPARPSTLYEERGALDRAAAAIPGTA